MMQEFGEMGFSQHEYVMSNTQGAAQKARAQSYNVFADPSLELAFWGGAPTPPTPTPSPMPSPQPTPPPTPAPTPSGKCHAISAVVDDDWCNANRAAGFCPSDLCQCD